MLVGVVKESVAHLRVPMYLGIIIPHNTVFPSYRSEGQRELETSAKPIPRQKTTEPTYVFGTRIMPGCVGSLRASL